MNWRPTDPPGKPSITEGREQRLEIVFVQTRVLRELDWRATHSGENGIGGLPMALHRADDDAIEPQIRLREVLAEPTDWVRPEGDSSS